MMNKIEASIGICAYNEERNIGHLLKSILEQKTDCICIREIIVILDGSSDGTEGAVRDFVGEPRLRVIKLKERCGKYAAVNTFLKNAHAPLLILASADIILKEGCLVHLCAPFLCDERLGAAAARPIPVNEMTAFTGYAAHLYAHLRHCAALTQPKFSELIAFRNVIKEIPQTTVDEEQIACLMKDKGYRLAYVPEATYANKGPESLQELIVQRRRYHWGHLLLKRRYHYAAVALKIGELKRELWKELPSFFKKHWGRLAGVFLLESGIRSLARLDFFFKDPALSYKWPIALTTKYLDGKI